MSHDLAAERIDYSGDHLLEDTAPGDPYELFNAWLEDAFAARERGLLPEPTAVVISTVSAEGRPSSRTVLLKGIVDGGFTVFTNYDSQKGRDLAANPAVALLFGWYPLQRQVRVEGTAAMVPADESDAYFATRPRGSQLGAWASAQSSEIGSLAELQAAYAAAEERFRGGDVPRPDHWGGYRITPDLIEFWQGQPSRMHDRLRYRRSGSGWTMGRLAP
ncbi:pyridoxamine 5'-phosphate oxidase [Microlunatus sp. Gsoil 973]|uniref:pyridoxamine 5'-phosphate oxidase n=1 Tax=Microlunatus sp. Gsoil 973 TaxID=2672569 RepID=UPI0012B46AD6|nr:pyridoxamine 5'-phosphate oxidase [Microlunatus sp. Gsoil 973]QGN33633.1 pyridoxamine 5'-phosphate oxidase [Microlunatus sp. Gsoil 973]